MQKLAMVFLFLLLHDSVSGQKKSRHCLLVHCSFGEQSLQPGDEFSLNETQVVIGSLKFYLSRLQLLNKGKVCWEEENSFHLVDIARPSSLLFSLAWPDGMVFDSIRFHLGIDSLTNVSGAFGGDLDPTNGMYWAWQSGYINFKLEGKCPVSPSRDHSFQFHLGGYLPPHQSIQPVQLAAAPSDTIVLRMDVREFLEKIDLATQRSIMSPGIEAQQLSKLASETFRVNEKE